MQFQHSRIADIISGHKTQTRRPVKPEDYSSIVFGKTNDTNHMAVRQARGNGVIRYEVGRTYAVQPGRGKPVIWWKPDSFGMFLYERPTDRVGLAEFIPLRIRITAIRREDVRNISEDDVKAEGFTNRWEFLHLWAQLYDRNGRWNFDADRLEYWSYVNKADRHVWTFEELQTHIMSRPAAPYDAWALTFNIQQR